MAGGDNMGDFHQIFTGLLSTDNNVRQTTEESYQALPLETKVSYLFNAVQNLAGDINEKQMAAIMLRRLMANKFMDFYSHLSPENQKQFKNDLLLSVNNEKNDIIRKIMCDVASEVAKNHLDDDGNNSWPELLNFLFQCANSPSNDMKDSALIMLTNVPGVFGNQQSSYLVVIKQLFQQSINVPDSNVQVKAVKAICAFVLHHDRFTEIQKHFTDLLPNMMRIINESLIAEEDDSLIKLLVGLAKKAPVFLRSQLSTIVEMCLRYLGNEEATDYHQMYLEVIMILAETAPQIMHKELFKHIIQLIGPLMELMITVKDDDDWDNQNDLYDIDLKSMSVIAESALNRLACGIGGKIMLPHILNNVSSMLVNPSWKERYAALMAISAVGKGCKKQMLFILPLILDRILTFLQDSHPRVRFATGNVIVQMSADLAPAFQNTFHDKIVPAILLLLEDNLNPRVQAHAGAALLNFSEDCPKRTLLSYMDLIMVKLESILQACIADFVKGGGRRLVLEQMVATIASIADRCEGDFVKFYDQIMPYLKEIICNTVAPELKLLRGKTIECISSIGLAVGQEKFLADASVVMDLMMETHNKDEKLSEDDPQTSYLILSSLARMCKVMGQQFEQYLPLVIGPVMNLASLQPEVAFLSNDEMSNMTNKSEWEFAPLWNQQSFGIKTSSLDHKASACEMLVCYAQEFKTGFSPYTEEIVKLMVPLLKFYFHDNVRISAAQSMPSLLECAEIRGPEYLQHIWGYICPDLVQAIEFETDLEVCAEMYDALGKCIELLRTGCLSDKWMKDLLHILEKNLNSYFENEAQRFEIRNNIDYDDVVEESLALEETDDVHKLSRMTDILHALFVIFKADFLQYFDLIVHQFAKLLDSDKSASDHKWGLCVFNDLIEYCGPGCAKYQEYFLQPMIDYVMDIDSDVRKAAIYGCGMLGMCGGPSFAGVCAEIMPFLLQVINHSEARSAKNIRPTENAVSAIAKILEYNSSAVNVNEILPLWLSKLPICEETNEAPFVYGYLCKLFVNHHPLFFGQNNSNILSLIRIIVDAFVGHAIERSHIVADQMVMVVSEIRDNQSEVFSACLDELTPLQLMILDLLFNW